jgi:hypothetical protein
VAPVVPEVGLIAILAVLMWFLGGLFTQGATTGRVTVMLIPAGTVYLQFAVFDRRPAGVPWMIASAVVVGLAIASVALDRSDGVGRARDESGLPMAHASPRAAMVMMVLVGFMSIAAATNATGVVSEYGNLPWRPAGTGIGGFGGVQLFDRFVDLRQRLISRENALLFQVTLGQDSPPGDRIYWRMETLDQFDGVGWRRSNSQTRVYSPATPIGDADHAYRGTTRSVLQRVFISRLGGTLLPTAGQPTAIHQIGDPDALNPQAIRFGRDGALFHPVGISSDDQYQLESAYPVVEADLGALATGPDGNLSPIFASAAEAGEFTATPAAPPGGAGRPPDMDRFLDLPSNTPVRLQVTARQQTRGATTDFEKAWMLQHWFRDSGEFTYSQEVSTGHGALVLEDWLTSPASQNYRTGYCEQFAAAMAVLGRLLDIPTRVVWGFTPGRMTTVGGVDVVEVRDVNAHAWVEVWIDGFGWVTFDPTPRGDVLPPSMTADFDPVRHLPPPEEGGGVIGPEEQDPTLDDLPPVFNDSVDDPRTGTDSAPRWWLIGAIGVALAATSIPVAKTVRSRRRMRRARKGDITAAWDELVDRLSDLGDPVSPSLTPVEWARSMGGGTMVPLARNYAAAVYGNKTPTVTEQDLTEVEWWIQNRYDGTQRLLAAFNPRSLLDRD